MWHRKILIGISLAVSLGLTLTLGTILTPPFPKLSNLLAAFEKIQEYKNNFQLPKITIPTMFTKISTSTLGQNGAGNNSTGNNNNNPFGFSQGNNNSNTNPQTIPTEPINNGNGYPTDVPEEPEPTTPGTNPTAKPTNKPKPTKVPKPTPTEPLKLNATRPGKNFQEAADIISPIICIPSAMIMATLDNEYGAWMPQIQADWTNKNTYTGSDPHNKPGSTAVVGVMQMMEDTWSRIKPIVSQKFGGAEMSIAVTFDAMAAGGYHLRNISLAMQDKISCDDWPVKYILYGACRYNGACAPGSTTYNQYSYNVCNAYNRYTKGPQKKCQ